MPSFSHHTPNMSSMHSIESKTKFLRNLSTYLHRNDDKMTKRQQYINSLITRFLCIKSPSFGHHTPNIPPLHSIPS